MKRIKIVTRELRDVIRKTSILSTSSSSSSNQTRYSLSFS
jgi:hypothetical protein